MTLRTIILAAVVAAAAFSSRAATTAGQVITGYGRLNGSTSLKMTFQVVSPTDYTVQLGNNNNACISEYTEGTVTVPATIYYGGMYYSVTSVSDWAFRLCNKVTSINFADNSVVSSIGEFAFSGCRSLATVDLPPTVKNIGSGAFCGCDLLRNFTVHTATPATLGYTDPFQRANTNCTLHVPYGAAATYKAALTRGVTVWKNWFNVIKEAEPTPDVNVDGEITVADVTAVYDIILGIDNTYNKTADVNGDSEVTVADATIIYNVILGS